MQQPDHKAPAGVETFTWRGQTRYRCPLNWESGAKCKFDTHDLELLKHHMTKGNHARLVTDDKGNVKPISVAAHSDPNDAATVAKEFENLRFAPEPKESGS